MAKMVFDEWYGELTYAQRAAYKKHNVSPADHDDLVRVYGADAHALITEAVKDTDNQTPGGMFSSYLLHNVV